MLLSKTIPLRQCDDRWELHMEGPFWVCGGGRGAGEANCQLVAPSLGDCEPEAMFFLTT